MDNSTSSDVDPLSIDILMPEAQQEVVTTLFAPCVVGWILACFGAGWVLSTSMAYITGPLYRKDKPAIKAAVWLVLVFVLMSSAINANEIYHYLVSQARDYDTMSDFTTADALSCLPQALVQALVQLVLGERACGLIRDRQANIGARCVLYFFIFASFVFGVMNVVLSFLLWNGLPSLPLSLNTAGLVWYSLAALIDIVIVSVLVRDLAMMLKTSARQETDDVLRGLIVLSIWTSATTVLIAVAAAIASAAATNQADNYGNIVITFGSILPCCYALAMLNTLSARERLRDQLRGGCTCGGGGRHEGMVTSFAASASRVFRNFSIAGKGEPVAFEKNGGVGAAAGRGTFGSPRAGGPVIEWARSVADAGPLDGVKVSRLVEEKEERSASTDELV